MATQSGFASRLRWWRQHRGISQVELAGRADISQRHLSFLELGRARPSREMVLRLAAALDVPLRPQNALLLAAGFAPVWRESELAAPELAQVRRGLDHILRQQEPFPAVVVDRRWNLLQANAGAVSLVEFLVGPLTPGVSVNLADALLWQGSATAAVDLHALVPKPWNRSDAIDIRVEAGVLRVLGTVAHMVKEGHLDVKKAEQVVVWEAPLGPA